jgi:hypothetical protein
MNTDGYVFSARDDALGQGPFRAPSVFNFYPSDFPLPLGEGLLSPPSKLMTTAAIVARHNLVYDWTIAGDANRGEFKPKPGITGARGTQPLWEAWETADVDTQLERIELLMLENGLTRAQRSAIRAAMLAVTDQDAATEARERAQVALYLAASSPLFQIDR